MDTAQRVALRYAAFENFDLSSVAKLRKDFLVLVKNVKLVLAKAPKQWDDSWDPFIEVYQEFREVVIRFRKAFKRVIFDKLIDESIGYSLKLTDRDVEALTRTLRESAWDFYIEMPMDKDPWRQGTATAYLKKWDKRLRRKAQTFWKVLKSSLERYEDLTKTPLSINVPEHAVIEGFKTKLFDFDPQDEHHQQKLTLFRSALKAYRKAAMARVPWLIQNQLLWHLDFSGSLSTRGMYLGSHVLIHAVAPSMNTPKKMTHVLAHEMGHHMFAGLSGAAQEFWNTAIKQDFGPINLDELLNVWPEGMPTSILIKNLAHKDPVMALQLDLLSWDHQEGGMEDREDFVAARAAGEVINVPKTPISGYAGKNPEEAFCEAIGLLVAYGPRAVHKTVQRWLNIVMPGEVRLARRVAKRFAAAIHEP